MVASPTQPHVPLGFGDRFDETHLFLTHLLVVHVLVALVTLLTNQDTVELDVWDILCLQPYSCTDLSDVI